MHPPHLAAPARPASQAPVRTGIVCTALSGLLLLLVAVEWGPLMSFDRTVADGLHGPAVDHPGITKANRILSDWAWDPWMMRALMAVAVGWLLWQGERLLALWAVATSVAGVLLQQGLKAAVGRERPQWPDPVDSAHFAAWPSGHAMTATVTFGLLLWLLGGVRRGPAGHPRALRGADPRLRTAVLVVGVVSVVGVGLTRMYLGVHWPTDVLGGWLLGVALVALSVVAYGRRANSREGTPV